MHIVIQDLGAEYSEKLKDKADKVIFADGRYAPCQGCFRCWTKHPASCAMKDSLHEICRVIGQADNLTVITENCYGGHSPAVKNLLDRSIGISTPFSTYRGRQMHHTLRYGRHNKLTLIAYGEIREQEGATLRLINERNAINDGFTSCETILVGSKEEVEGVLV